MYNEEDINIYGRHLKFNCPEDFKITELDECETYCKRKDICDIYATMLDEIYKK